MDGLRCGKKHISVCSLLKNWPLAEVMSGIGLFLKNAYEAYREKRLASPWETPSNMQKQSRSSSETPSDTTSDLASFRGSSVGHFVVTHERHSKECQDVDWKDH